MKSLSHNSGCMHCKYTCGKDVFTEEDRHLIDSNKSEISFEPGEIILKQDTYVSQVVYLKSGLIKEEKEAKNKRSTIIKLVKGNNFVDLSVLGDPIMYPFSAVAITKCQVCFIRKETILKVMEQNKLANNYLLKWYAHRCFYLYKKIATISTLNSHGRLATALLYLTGEHFNNDTVNSISRKDLAGLASISLESSNKILAELKHDQIIDIDKSSIRIIRRDLIEKLSNAG